MFVRMQDSMILIHRQGFNGGFMRQHQAIGGCCYVWVWVACIAYKVCFTGQHYIGQSSQQTISTACATVAKSCMCWQHASHGTSEAVPLCAYAMGLSCLPPDSMADVCSELLSLCVVTFMPAWHMPESGGLFP
jgi:hypothetical protein